MSDPKQTITKRLRKQAEACRWLGSDLYGDLLERAAQDVEAGGVVYEVMRDHASAPPGAAVALRLMGAVHRLVLQGVAPELGEYYPSVGGARPPDRAWPAFKRLLEQRGATVASLLDRPVQTNEVGRAAGLVGGFLEIADASGLPLRILEVGASAGLNLRWDHFSYRAEEWSWGPEDSPVLLDGFERPPPFAGPAQVVERAGCDSSPLDPTGAEDRLTLSSYVWPDQARRWKRLRGALEIAQKIPATVQAEEAHRWLGERLSEPVPGVTTIVYHSIVLQYLSTEERSRFVATLNDAGRRASPSAPLAWLRMEPPAKALGQYFGEEAAEAFFPDTSAAGYEELADVHIVIWPGGRQRLVAKAGYHGEPVVWFG